MTNEIGMRPGVIRPAGRLNVLTMFVAGLLLPTAAFAQNNQVTYGAPGDWVKAAPQPTARRRPKACHCA